MTPALVNQKGKSDGFLSPYLPLAEKTSEAEKEASNASIWINHITSLKIVFEKQSAPERKAFLPRADGQKPRCW